ncbi:hypothetical protein C0J52_26090 [Blattella germanica]|nr:hypothetical protein C0J52_26090 [Blattella germanica]
MHDGCGGRDLSIMLPYMPFVNEYWPFIVAGIVCYLGARFLYHSAVSWNPEKPRGGREYRTPDQGEFLNHKVRSYWCHAF